jgi:multiple sugar transport system ATP-binding protein
MSEIRLESISKRFGKVQALQDVSFSCAHGEFFCLLGPSGAGKTTTLNTIAGIEKPDQGEVYVDGQRITHLPPQERDIAIAFESYALYPHLTVFDNLAFPLRAPGRAKQYPRGALEARVKEVAEMLGMSELLGRYPRQLSGGQRQRVALGRALVRQPRVYLLDEPIAHLDAKLRHRMRGELKKIQSDLGITTIYSTPDQLEALSMADTVAVINQGHVEQIGKPDDIYFRPCNVFVARLVGDPPMNIVAAELNERSVVVTSSEPFRIAIPEAHAALLAAKARPGKLLVGVRPVDVHLVAGCVDNACATGRVKANDPLGQVTITSVQVGNVELKARISTRGMPPRGSTVSLVVDGNRVHYFDSESGRRIES